MILECYRKCGKYENDEILYANCVERCMNNNDKRKNGFLKYLFLWLYLRGLWKYI